MSIIDTDVAVIGAGPVGLFSVFQAGMLSMKCCVVDIFDQLGGQCAALYPEKPIYDIPAYPSITGMNLVKALEKQASPFKPKYLLGRAVADLEKLEDFLLLNTTMGETIRSKLIIIAAGAGAFQPNKPPIPNIEQFEEKSIFYSVTDRRSLQNKSILIVGGGDSAVDWALSLSEIAKVTLMHRRDSFRAAPDSVAKLRYFASVGKINLVVGYHLHELEGCEGILRNVVVKNMQGVTRTIKSDILLPFFGLKQNIDAISSFGLEVKNKHLVVRPPYCSTNIKGVYAVGDIATYDGKIKLILTGFSEVAAAMHHAYTKVLGKQLRFQYSTTKGVNCL